MKFSDLLFIHHAFSPFIFDQILKLSNLIILFLPHPASFILILSCFFLQDILQFPNGRLIGQRFISLLFDLIPQLHNLSLQSSIPLLIILNNPQLFGQYILQLFNRPLIRLTLSPLFLYLVPQELYLLLVPAALLIILLDLPCLVVGVLYLLVQDTLEFADLALVDHALASLIFNDIPQLFDLVVILLPGLAMLLNVSYFFLQNILQLSDSSLISQRFVPLLLYLLSQ